MTHAWHQRPDGLYVVDDEIPVATAREQAEIDGVIGRHGRLIRAASRATGVEYPELVAFEWTESRGNPAARSPAGALGVMQILPSTFHDYRPNATIADMLDPAQSLQVGAEYLARSHRKGLDLIGAASEYNAGPGPHLDAGNPWGLRMQCQASDCYADKIVRAYNYVKLRTLRVMLRGDSIMLGAAADIAAALDGLPVVLVGPYGTPPVQYDAVVGDSIAKVRARLPAALAAVGRPSVIVQMAGANDVPGRASPADMASAEAASLMDDAVHADAVIAVAIPPQPAAATIGRAGVPAAYNAALDASVLALSARGKPIVFADPGLTDSDISPDGIHPNAGGRRKIAASVADHIAAIAHISRPIALPGGSRPWYVHPVALGAGLAVVGIAAWKWWSR